MAVAAVHGSRRLWCSWHASGIAVVLSLLQPRRESALRVELKQIDYSTSGGFNLAALAITAILIALYATWW